MAAMVWFVILTYAWHMSFQALGRIQDRIDKKSAYFHLMAWCLPLVFTVTVMALGEIAGNSVTGICFLSYTHHYVRVWFLLAPIIVVLLVGGYFLSRGESLSSQMPLFIPLSFVCKNRSMFSLLCVNGKASDVSNNLTIC